MKAAICSGIFRPDIAAALKYEQLSLPTETQTIFQTYRKQALAMLTRRQFGTGLLTALFGTMLGAHSGENNRVEWSKPVAGLRMGMDWQVNKHGRGLRLTLENTGRVNLGVLVAWNGNGSFSYDFQFHLRSGNTADEYIFGGSNPDEPHAELVSIAYGLVLPIIWRLDAGSSHSLVFPVDEFWRTSKGAPHDLEQRLKASEFLMGSEFNVRLKVDERELNSPMMGGMAPMKNGAYWFGDLIGTIAGS
jgi:hypothetical protein